VAQAFQNVHPTYYFLIDRDHNSDDEINSCWDNFLKPDTPNLLIWRKKEIENYFLDPSFLIHSKFIKEGTTEEMIQNKLVHFSKQNVYMGIANQVIISIREELKKNWIEIFNNNKLFKNAEEALRNLNERNEFSSYADTVSQKIRKEEIERRFVAIQQKMLDGNKLQWGKGQWLDLLPGKKILHDILGTDLFSVVGMGGKKLTGKDKETEIIKNLLSQKTEILPIDFRKLKELMENRN